MLDRRGRPARRPGRAGAGARRRSAPTSGSTRACAPPTRTCCEPADRWSGPCCAPPIRSLSRPAAPVDPDDPEVLAVASIWSRPCGPRPAASGWPRRSSASRCGCSCSTSPAIQKPVAARVWWCWPTPSSSRRGSCAWAGRDACRYPISPATSAARHSIVVRGMVPGPVPHERVIEADAFEARAFGHELDHLDGLLFLDRVAGAQAVHPRKRYL